MTKDKERVAIPGKISRRGINEIKSITRRPWREANVITGAENSGSPPEIRSSQHLQVKKSPLSITPRTLRN
jgi:hypothetical protein